MHCRQLFYKSANSSKKTTRIKTLKLYKEKTTSTKMNSNSTTLYATAVAFFAATNLFVGIRTDANLSKSFPDTSSISPDSQKNSLTSSTINVEPLRKNIFGSVLSAIFSPDIFSHPDPLAYLLPRVTGKGYNGGREGFAYMTMRLESTLHIVDPFLKGRKFPKPYIPYGKLLSSLVSCLIKLQKVATHIREIHLKHSKESDYPPPPSDISTPELSSLLSSDIFSDSNIPMVLLQKILKIPKEKIPDVKQDLVKVLNNHIYFEQPYYFYMHFLLIFFQRGDDELHRLRYDNAAILKRISILNKLSSATVDGD